MKSVAGVGAISSAIPSAWIKPVIDVVVLPAHAQTSCHTLDILGDWEFVISNSNGSVDRFTVTLNPNGTVSSSILIGNYEWSLTNNTLSIDPTEVPDASRYSGTLNSNCNQMEGIVSFFPGPGTVLPTFVANKIN